MIKNNRTIRVKTIGGAVFKEKLKGVSKTHVFFENDSVIISSIDYISIHPRATIITGLTLLGIGSVSILGGAAVLASALTSNNGLTMLVGIIVGPILVLSGTIADVISLPFLLSSTHYWLDDDGAWRIAT